MWVRSGNEMIELAGTYVCTGCGETFEVAETESFMWTHQGKPFCSYEHALHRGHRADAMTQPPHAWQTSHWSPDGEHRHSGAVDDCQEPACRAVLDAS